MTLKEAIDYLLSEVLDPFQESRLYEDYVTAGLDENKYAAACNILARTLHRPLPMSRTEINQAAQHFISKRAVDYLKPDEEMPPLVDRIVWFSMPASAYCEVWVSVPALDGDDLRDLYRELAGELPEEAFELSAVAWDDPEIGYEN